MATKKKSYIDMPLAWLEKKAKEIRDYCDETPISRLEDRIVGGKVTATREAQIKSIRESLHDYVRLLEAIDKLKQEEEKTKLQTRGDQELSPLESGEI